MEGITRLRGLLDRFTMGDYDSFKYRISELLTGSHGFKDGGRG